MKATSIATFVALLVVGCGEDAEFKIQEARESGATKLDLYRSEISDLSPLKELTNLTWLDLGSNQITDVSPLKGLTNLESLYLMDNPISEDQKAMLRKALPNCRISFD